MLTLPPAVKLWACTEPVDFRKSYAGLALLVRSVMGMDPLSGHIFCFFNGRRDQLRLLFWDRSGYLWVGKKLERGSFKVPWKPQAHPGHVWELEAVEALLKLIEQLRDDNNRKALQLARLLRERYGTKSEKLDPLQLNLFLKSVSEQEQAQAPTEADKEELDALQKRLKELREKNREKTTSRPGRRPLPEDLPRETIRIPVPDAQRHCDDCGEEKSPIGMATSSVLEFVPASFKVIVYEREKVACRKCEAGVVCAPAADKPIDGGLPGPRLLAHLAVSKYLEHMPLHRLSNYYKRLGVALSASTLGQWVGVVSDWLAPLYTAL